MKRLIVFLLLLNLYSCKESARKEEVSIVDDLGYNFTFEKIPVRVISLAPSITESIYYLGADENLIGVTNYCDYPEQAKNKTIIGGMLDPNLEIITKLNPDLIFLTTEGNSQITYKSLKDLGFKVFVLNPRNVTGIVSTLEKLCSIFKNKTSDENLVQFRKEIDLLSKIASKRDFAGFLALKPLISFNKNTFLNDIFVRSGFKNIYGDEKLDYPGIAEEDLFIKDPEYLFIFGEKNDDKIKIVKDELETKFRKLKSVKNKNYHILDESVFTRPGPRVIESLKILHTIVTN